MTKFSGRFARTTARLAAAVIITGGLAAIPATMTSANAGAVADPNYQAPTVGQCRNYGAAAAPKQSNSTPVTPCSSQHTAKVFYVGRLPEALTWASSDAAVGNAVSHACGPAFDKALGATEKVRRMSAYSYVWFEPTLTQQEHGARWFRCDVVMWGHSTLAPIPNVSNPMLSNGLKYGITRCLWGSDTIYSTTCKMSHTYRATGAFSITGTSYPGNTAIRNTALRRCPNFVSTRAYYWSGPDRESWTKYGDRIFVCYSKLAH